MPGLGMRSCPGVQFRRGNVLQDRGAFQAGLEVHYSRSEWIPIRTGAFRAALGRAGPGPGVQRGFWGGSGWAAEETAVKVAQDPRLGRFGDVPCGELCIAPAPPAPGGTCCWRNGRAAAATTEDPPLPPPGPHGGPFTLETPFSAAPPFAPLIKINK